MVLYFTGTGNSRRAARLIAEATGDECVSMNELIKDGERGRFGSDKPWVFATPTHGWRIPKTAEDFIRSSTFTGAREAYFVMTCGTDTGNAGAYNRRLCADIGLEYMGTATVLMPENYLAMFPVPEGPEAAQIVAAGERTVRAAAEHVARGEPLPTEPLSSFGRAKSSFINTAFRAMFIKDKAFYATDECIACGMCAEVCPVNNIELKENRHVWLGKCIHCMACIAYCPVEAIEYGRVSKGKNRYHLDD